MEYHKRFITLEGIDGAGKSTHSSWLCEELENRGHKVVMTREPGGTPLGEKLRQVLLEEEMSIEAEVLLIFSARIENVQKIILPALKNGSWVISDRFVDTTYAYQGGGEGFSMHRIEALEKWTNPILQPGLTLFLDLPTSTARRRLEETSFLDHFERRDPAFFERVRRAYHERARQHSERFCIVDSTTAVEKVRAFIASVLL